MSADLLCEHLKVAHSKANTAIVMIDNRVNLRTVSERLDQIADNIVEAAVVLDRSNLVHAHRIRESMKRAKNHLEDARGYLRLDKWTQASASIDKTEQYVNDAIGCLPGC